MSKYLITGLCGFAGPHLANLLYEKGHKIYGLIRRENGLESDILDTVSQECFDSIEFIKCDFTDYYVVERVFKEYKFDGVFHLGAMSLPPQSFIDPLGTFKTNIMGSANIIQAITAHQPKCKLLFVSTSEVYGNSITEGEKIKETDKLCPSNPYGVSKAAIDLYMQERMANKKIKGCIVRPFSYTGIRRGKNFSISCDAFQVGKIMKKMQVPIIKVGNLHTIRTVIDVRDVVYAWYLLMGLPDSDGEIFNICGDIPRKMSFFTDYLIKLAGGDIRKVVDKNLWRPIDIQYQCGDVSKLKELTGWKSKIPIKETLESLLNYWLKKLGE